MPGSGQGLRLPFSHIPPGRSTPENSNCSAFDGSLGHLTVCDGERADARRSRCVAAVAFGSLVRAPRRSSTSVAANGRTDRVAVSPVVADVQSSDTRPVSFASSCMRSTVGVSEHLTVESRRARASCARQLAGPRPPASGVRAEMLDVPVCVGAWACWLRSGNYRPKSHKICVWTRNGRRTENHDCSRFHAPSARCPGPSSWICPCLFLCSCRSNGKR